MNYVSAPKLAPPSEIRVLGYRVHPLTGDEVIGQIAAAVAGKRRLVMANLNVHAMAVMFENRAMARLLNQPDTQVMIDGMPIVMMANLFGHRLTRDKRVTSLDFYDRLFQLGQSAGWKFGYVGTTPETLEKGLATLRARIPGLDIDGIDGFFDISDDTPGSRQAAILEWMNERAHDVVIVGMGMPRQEEWIERIQSRVKTTVLVPTGAYLEYQVGVQKLPPRWMGRMGLEWAHRLASSPRRLGYRYLVEPAVLAFKLATRRHPQADSGPAS